jgi:hypothetical protein
MRKKLCPEIPTLYHSMSRSFTIIIMRLIIVPEGASTRVIWLANEIGFPINVEQPLTDSSSLLRSSNQTELPVTKGGVITSFRDGQ